jgi:hypothetical protein
MFVFVEDDDDKMESCESETSCFSQLSTTMPQPEAELPQTSQLSSLNSDECSSAIAIVLSKKKKKKKKSDQIEDKDTSI